MNKKIIFILILTLVALAALAIYAFVPSLNRIGPQVNPASSKSTPEQVAVGSKSAVFNAYHNKDVTENFYTIKFPQDWQAQPSRPAGSYSFTFADGTAKSELMDVPDNTTLELFVLSQQKPKLQATPGYKETDYQKLSVNGNEAYQLTYSSNSGGEDYITTKTYITGQDQAAVITLTVRQKDLASLQDSFKSVINSFQWENKQ
jgi:hypothetical protein